MSGNVSRSIRLAPQSHEELPRPVSTLSVVVLSRVDQGAVYVVVPGE